MVAGDAHAHSGGPTEAFDNARRDVSKTLVALGFDKADIQQFSTHPKRYPADAPGRSDAEAIYQAAWTGQRVPAAPTAGMEPR